MKVLPSPLAYRSLIPAQIGGQPSSQFILSDGPLSTDQRKVLGANHIQALQMPLVARPVSILYSGPDDIKLSPCTLLGILMGDITR